MNSEIFKTDKRAAELKRDYQRLIERRNELSRDLYEVEREMVEADRALTDYLTSLEGGAA